MFIFGGGTGESYESLQRKRALANSLYRPGGTPRNIGEGIASIGNALAGAAVEYRLQNQERERRERGNKAFESIVAGLGGAPSAVSPAANPAASPAANPAASPAANPAASPAASPVEAPVDMFNASLAETESGGNYGVANDEGYVGKYQFGDERLADYQQATGEKFTKEQFRQNPDLQEKVQAWHVNDVQSFIADQGLDQYVGQKVGGVEMTPGGMIAVAHLGGKNGLRRYLTSGGSYNPADSNGTKLSDYAQAHAGTMAQPSAQTPAQPSAQPSGQTPMQQRVSPELLAALGSGDLNPQQTAIATAILQRQMQTAPQMTPYQAAQLDLRRQEMAASQESTAAERARQQENADRNYNLSANRLEMERKRFGQKSRVVAGSDAESMGLDPTKAYNIGPDGRVSQIGGKGVNVNVNEGLKLTEGQSKDIGFYARGLYANQDLRDVEQNLTNLDESLMSRFGTIGNLYASSEFRQAKIAADQFLSVILRKDTGAAITSQEFDLYGPMFLPMPGDDPAALEQKRKSRERAIKTIKLGLGTASSLANDVDDQFAKDYPTPAKNNKSEEGIPEGFPSETWSAISAEDRKMLMDLWPTLSDEDKAIWLN